MMQHSLATPNSLTAESVPPLWKELRVSLSSNSKVIIDLAGVETADSAGIAFLIAAYAFAKAQGKTIVLASISQELLNIARIGNVDELICRFENGS